MSSSTATEKKNVKGRATGKWTNVTGVQSDAPV